MGRSKKLVASAEAIGVESNLALKAQSEQMKATNQDIAEVDQGIRRANTGLSSSSSSSSPLPTPWARAPCCRSELATCSAACG